MTKTNVLWALAYCGFLTSAITGLTGCGGNPCAGRTGDDYNRCAAYVNEQNRQTLQLIQMNQQYQQQIMAPVQPTTTNCMPNGAGGFVCNQY